MVPCLNKNTLKLLTATADERYTHSPDYFRRTHYPQTMHRYHEGNLIETLSQDEFLEELRGTDALGNRIFFVFGSTGAGKSELLCWIKDEWKQQRIARPVIRISRSELNPQVLIQKCYTTLGLHQGPKVDHSKWSLLLHKPVTIVNQIIWSALSELYTKDEQIIPIALLLTPIVERNIVRFSEQLNRGKITEPLEVLTRKEFDEITMATTLPLGVDYFQFRQLVSHKLDLFLFDGQDVPTLIKELSHKVMELGIRPLLLIDDLIQSINIYAADLLDHFLSLEEGTWDIVVGLTPGGLIDTDSGRTLNERINNLSTISDRVKKLWLSDESGKTFYNLGPENVGPYIKGYLSELKRSQGFICGSTCPHFKHCRALLVGNSQIELLPLNDYLVQRIYDGIPIGKGKLRHTVLNAKEVLKVLLSRNARDLAKVTALLSRDRFVQHENPVIKTLGEWYVDLTSTTIELPAGLIESFGEQGPVIAPVHNLRSDLHETETVPNPLVQHEEIDLKQTRDWIDGQQINSQLLESVRLGASTVLHEIVKGTFMSRRFTPRNSATLQRTEITNKSRYPVVLQGEKVRRKSVVVGKTLSAIRVAELQQSQPKKRPSIFIGLSEEEDLAHWVYEAEEVRNQWLEEVELEIGMPIHVFAYQLKMWVEQWRSISNEAFQIKSPFTDQLYSIVCAFYEDWFLLRDNILDAKALQDLAYDNDFEVKLIALKPTALLGSFHFGNTPFDLFLVELKSAFTQYRPRIEALAKAEMERQCGMVPMLQCEVSTIGQSILSNLNQISQEHGMSLNRIRLIDQNACCLKEHGLHDKYNSVLNLQRILLATFKEWDQLREKVLALMNEVIEMYGTAPETNFDIWDVDRLQTEIDKWKRKTEVLGLVYSVLYSSPRSVIKRLLAFNDETDLFIKFMEAWFKLLAIVENCLAGMSVNENDLQVIQEWRSIEFGDLLQKAVLLNRAKQQLMELYISMQKDLGVAEGAIYKSELRNRIENHEKMSRSLKKKVLHLIDKGVIDLPRKRWKSLLHEIEETLPHTFANLKVQLSLE